MKIFGHEPGNAAGGLDAGLGDDDLAVAGEDVRFDSFGRRHESIRKKSGFAAAGGADDHGDLISLHGIDKASYIVIGNAELNMGVEFAEFAFDFNFFMLSFGMMDSPEAAGFQPVLMVTPLPPLPCPAISPAG